MSDTENQEPNVSIAKVEGGYIIYLDGKTVVTTTLEAAMELARKQLS